MQIDFDTCFNIFHVHFISNLSIQIKTKTHFFSNIKTNFDGKNSTNS